MEIRRTKPIGEKIRELRESAGKTQEVLAAMSGIDRRTIQRAESGKAVQMESLSSIASALNVPLTQIIEATDNDKDDVENLAAQSLIVLRPIQSGMGLINLVQSSFDGKMTCEAEPTTENIDVLTALISTIEEMMPDPWRTPTEKPAPSLSSQLRQAVTLTELIKQLSAFGITAFVGTYTASAQVPYYDMDEGHMYVTNRTPYKLVTICRVMIAQTTRGDRITLKVDDLYVPPKATALEPDSTENIPF